MKDGIPPPPEQTRRRSGQLVPMTKKGKIPIKDVVEELDKKGPIEIPDEELPKVPPITPSLAASILDLPDQFEWKEDPSTFTFERLVFGEEPLEDTCVIHENLEARFRTLTGKETAELNTQVRLFDLQTRNAGTMDHLAIRTMARTLVSICGRELPPVVAHDLEGEGVDNPYARREEFLYAKAKPLIDVLSQAYNEFDRRVTRMTLRGNPGNFSRPRSASPEPSSGESE